MQAINYSLIGSVSSLTNIELDFDEIMIIFKLYWAEQALEKVLETSSISNQMSEHLTQKAIETLKTSSALSELMPEYIHFLPECKAFYIKTINDVAAHYYGFINNNTDELISSIISFEYNAY